jgi:hypothetical protein
VKMALKRYLVLRRSVKTCGGCEESAVISEYKVGGAWPPLGLYWQFRDEEGVKGPFQTRSCDKV